MPRVNDLNFRTIVRPLRTTFATALGRKRHMMSVLVTVSLEDGTRGTGEVPTSFAFPGETVDVIGRTLSDARSRMIGLDIGDWEAWVREFRRESSGLPMTVSGLEVALFRAHLAETGISEHAYWGASTRHLKTDITIPLLIDASAIEKWIRAASSKGFAAYKLKIGGERGRDEALLSSVYAALQTWAPGFRLRLDGNQGYSTPAFLGLLDHIEEKGYAVELFEQPLPKEDLKGYEEVMKRRSVPVFLDESVCSASDAARVMENGLCDGVNIKIAKTGITETAAIVDMARREGKKLMAGCMIETAVGLSTAIFAAAGTDAFDAIDLDSVHFLYGPNRYKGIEIFGPDIAVALE